MSEKSGKLLTETMVCLLPPQNLLHPKSVFVEVLWLKLVQGSWSVQNANQIQECHPGWTMLVAALFGAYAADGFASSGTAGRVLSTVWFELLHFSFANDCCEVRWQLLLFEPLAVSDPWQNDPWWEQRLFFRKLFVVGEIPGQHS